MRAYAPDDIQEERDQLVERYLAMKKYMHPKKFVEKYASDKYKKFIKEEEKRIKELKKQGIIV